LVQPPGSCEGPPSPGFIAARRSLVIKQPRALGWGGSLAQPHHHHHRRPLPPPPAQADTYSYCPHYALAWHYRKLNLLAELLRYRADIMCLQEVQSDHFSDFLAPELQKHGYSSIYKKKTAEM
jgi:hypothetical protein